MNPASATSSPRHLHLADQDITHDRVVWCRHPAARPDCRSGTAMGFGRDADSARCRAGFVRDMVNGLHDGDCTVHPLVWRHPITQRHPIARHRPTA